MSHSGFGRSQRRQPVLGPPRVEAVSPPPDQGERWRPGPPRRSWGIWRVWWIWRIWWSRPLDWDDTTRNRQWQQALANGAGATVLEGVGIQLDDDTLVASYARGGERGVGA